MSRSSRQLSAGACPRTLTWTYHPGAQPRHKGAQSRFLLPTHAPPWLVQTGCLKPTHNSIPGVHARSRASPTVGLRMSLTYPDLGPLLSTSNEREPPFRHVHSTNLWRKLYQLISGPKTDDHQVRTLTDLYHYHSRSLRTIFIRLDMS